MNPRSAARSYRRRILFALVVLTIADAGISASHAQESAPKDESPWILVPTLTSNPKLGTSLGLIGGYLYQFDPDSQQSVFALSTSYSDTDYRVAGLLGQMFLDQDRQKVILGLVDGRIENDYKDFLGTGLPVQTTDVLSAEFARYYHLIHGSWYGRIQLISTN